jgi:hypothetical protein
MPRNGSGQYALPSGGGVVTAGTTIESAWANALTADIATELQSSLDRSGRGPMLAPLKLAAGSVAAPALSFDAEPGSGLYRQAAGSLDVSILGTHIHRFKGNGLEIRGAAGIGVSLQLCANGASAGTNTFDFQQDSAGAADIVQRKNARLSIYTNATERIQITAAGVTEIKAGATVVGGFANTGSFTQGGGDFSINDAGVVDTSACRVVSSGGALYLQAGDANNIFFRSKAGVANMSLAAGTGILTALGFVGPLTGNVTGAMGASISAGAGLSGTSYNGSTARTFSIASNSNGYGVRTVSTSAASGVPSDGDIWYQREA